MDKVKFLCNGSPQFKAGEEAYQAKPGFNEMPKKFTSDPYYKMCKDSKIVQDFVSSPTDKQHEEFDAQIKAERQKSDDLAKQNEELLKQIEALKGEAPDDKSKK
jgi:mannose-6-phosphate isomerase class I